MKATLRYHPLAEKELIESAEFYEALESGLGSRFLDEIARAERFIVRNPEIWPDDDRGRRRQKVAVFPFNLIYRLENETVFVLAVAHSSRIPNYFKDRD